VYPQSLNIGIFTTSVALDNIDNGPTSTSSHGTGISFFQHPHVHHISIEQARVPLSKSNRKIIKLQNYYTSVPTVLTMKDPPIPEMK
jgi:hypothetical protein